MSVRQRFAIGALLLGGASAWSPINHRSFVKHQPPFTNTKQNINDFCPIQWVAAGIVAASVAFAPLPSEAMIDPTPVGNDLSVKVQTNDDDVTISFSLPRSLIKSIDIDDNKGQPKQGDKVVPPPVMPAPENSMTDVVKGALNALTGKEEPKVEEKQETLTPESNVESKAADVKNEEPKPGEAKMDEQKPVEKINAETPAVVEQKQESAKVEEPTAEIPKQEVKKEPSAPVEVKKDEPPKSIEEKKPEPAPVEAQIESPKPAEAKKEEPEPIQVKKEEPPKAVIVEQAKPAKSSTLSGSVLDKVNKADEASKVETPKPEVPKPTPRAEVTRPFARKKESPKSPPVVSKSTNVEESTEPSGAGNVFSDFASKFKGKKKEKVLPFWGRPAFQTTINSRNGEVHLAVSNGQVAGVTVVGLGAALVATFKADNSGEREEGRETTGSGATATNKAGPKPTGPSSASGDARSFLDATIESTPTTTVEKDDTSENGIGSLLSAFLKPKKDDDTRDDHKRRDLQKEEAVAAAKRAISTKRKAASTRGSQPPKDSMPTVGGPSNTMTTDNSSPASSFPSRTGDSDPVRSEGTSRSPYRSTDSDSAVPERSGDGSSSVGTSSQQQIAPPVDGTPSPNTQDPKEPVPTTRFDETTGRYVFEYGGTIIYEWEQNVEEIIIYIKAPPGITEDQIACNIFPRQLQLGLRGGDRFFIDKETYDFVVTSESSWYMNGDTIQITLQKARRGESWERALQTLGTSNSPSRTAPAPPSSAERSNPVTAAPSATEIRSAPQSSTNPPGFGAGTVTGPPNASTPGLDARTGQTNIASGPSTPGPPSGGIPGVGASSFTDALSTENGSSKNTPPTAISSGVPAIGATSFTNALSSASSSSSKPATTGGGGIPGFGAPSNTGGPTETESSGTNTPPGVSSSGVTGIGASSFTDALSSASASSSKPSASRGGGIPGFGAPSNTGGPTETERSGTNTPPGASSSGVTGIGASSFTDALSNANSSNDKPPSSGSGIPGFGATSFSSSSAPPPAPRPVPAPPASVPSTAPQANRPAVPSTTLPSREPSTTTSAAASYAEQMRATAPAESENIDDGASDAYLAAMSGAASAPRVSPAPPPSPPPAQIGRTERVKPSSTSEDANTAAGADYLSRMGGGIPQKQPQKQESSSSMSGGIPGFGPSSTNAGDSAGSSSTMTDTPSRPKSGGIPGVGASSFTDALSNQTTNGSPVPPPPAPVARGGTNNEATPSFNKEEVTKSGPSANDSAPQPKVSLIFKNNVGGGTSDRSESLPQANKAVRRKAGPSPTAGSTPPAETSAYSSGPAYSSRQPSPQSVPPQSPGTSRSHLDPLTGGPRNDASRAGNRPFMDGDSNTKTSSSPKSFNPRTEAERRKAQADALAEAKRKFAEEQGSSKSEPASYLSAFRKPMAPRPAASNEESEKGNREGGAFMSGLPNFSDPGRAEGYNLNPAIAEKAKQIREAMEAAKKGNQPNKNEPNDTNGPPYRRN